MTSARLSLALVSVALLGCVTTPPPESPVGPPALGPEPGHTRSEFRHVGSLELLGAADLPSGLFFENEPVGGLSGLVWDPGAGRFLALADDPSERAPARFYELAVDLSDGRLDAGDVRVTGRVRLTFGDGAPWPAGSIDPEGFARAPDGTLYVGSEGVRRSGAPPLLSRFARDGREIERFELPARYLPSADERRGTRPNEAFESLTVTPDGALLIAGVESALAQDGPRAGPATPSAARLLLRGLRGGADRELVYAVDPVEGRAPAPDSFFVNGLVDLLALGPERLLALEREYVAGVGGRTRLFEIELAGATDVAALDELAAGGFEPVRKRLLVDFAELGIELDNFEAVALGPELADGRRVLLVVSDDNFDSTAQRTRFVAFAAENGTPTIAAVQGAGHRSPLEGRWVAGLEGVVTAVDAGAKPPAFFLQSMAADGDPATSEGVRVTVGEGRPPEVGDRLRVGGRVEERAFPRQLGVTSLKMNQAERLGEGGALPPPVRIDPSRVPPAIDADGLAEFRPERDAIDFWESLEGMRVELPPAIVTGPTLVHDELVVALDPASARTPRGGLLLTPAGPPLTRAFLSGRLVGGLPHLAVGERIGRETIGIVDYSYSNYKVLVVPDDRCAAPRSTLGPRAGHLTIATSNVENLSATDPAERFDLAGRVIARELRAPAIVALEEIQDDSGKTRGDGVVSAERTLARLIEAIVAAGGPRYHAISIDPQLDREGGMPGGNIRVALLVDPARVGFERRGEAGPLDATAPVGRGAGLHLSLNPGRVAPSSTAFSPTSGEGVRRSLAVELDVDGRALFVVANHWSSKFDDDRAFGASQPPATPTAAKRVAQAEVVREFVDRLLEADPRARVVVLGDLNDSPWSEAVRRISTPPLVNLLLRLPESERYTYNFEGVSQALDYVIVSPSLAEGAEIEPLHRNTDCPERLRASDHDPIVARLALEVSGGR